MLIFLLLATGTASIFAFHAGVYFPIWLSVLCLSGVTGLLWWRYRQRKVGQLMLLFWLVFALPFIHIPPYLWFDFDREVPLLLWGMVIRPYMVVEEIVKLTAMIGATGGIGFCLGVYLHDVRIRRDTVVSDGAAGRLIQSLSLKIWLFWAGVGTLLSWLIAPKETLFTAGYTSSESTLETASFGSAVTISYGLLAYALCDAILDQNAARKAFKRKIIAAVVLYILLYLQLARGSRTAIPFVLACMITYFYWGAATAVAKKKFPMLKIALGGFGLVVLSMLIGASRDNLVGIEDIGGLISLFSDLNSSGKVGFSNLLRGTWSAILLTPLSVAGDHVYGLLDLKLGKDYLDILLSLPPGFVADALGYTRPLNDLTGPAWEMRYGMGGTHISVVPFMNFRMTGVLVIPALMAFLLTHLEKRALARLSAINLAFLCMIAASAPHFWWYGEKYGVNTFIVWGLLAICYRVSLSIRPLADTAPEAPGNTERLNSRASKTP